MTKRSFRIFPCCAWVLSEALCAAEQGMVLLKVLGASKAPVSRHGRDRSWLQTSWFKVSNPFQQHLARLRCSPAYFSSKEVGFAWFLHGLASNCWSEILCHSICFPIPSQSWPQYATINHRTALTRKREVGFGWLLHLVWANLDTRWSWYFVATMQFWPWHRVTCRAAPYLLLRWRRLQLWSRWDGCSQFYPVLLGVRE